MPHLLLSPLSFQDLKSSHSGMELAEQESGEGEIDLNTCFVHTALLHRDQSFGTETARSRHLCAPLCHKAVMISIRPPTREGACVSQALGRRKFAW